MPIIIPNTTTQDDYAEATTFKSGTPVSSGFLQIANNPVFVQLILGQEGGISGLAEEVGPVAQTILSITPPPNPHQKVYGLRVRSAVAGSPAQVAGMLSFYNDPGLSAGSLFTANVSPTGAVTLGLGVLDKNTAIITAGGGSSAELELYRKTIKAGTIGSGSVLEFMHEGIWSKNAAGDSFNFRWYLAPTPVVVGVSPQAFETGALTLTGSAGAQGVWRFNGFVWVVAAAAQEWIITADGPRNDIAAGPGATIGNFAAAANTLGGGIFGTSNGNTGVDLDLVFTCQCNTLSVNQVWQKRHALLQSF